MKKRIFLRRPTRDITFLKFSAFLYRGNAAPSGVTMDYSTEVEMAVLRVAHVLLLCVPSRAGLYVHPVHIVITCDHKREKKHAGIIHTCRSNLVIVGAVLMAVVARARVTPNNLLYIQSSVR